MSQKFFTPSNVFTGGLYMLFIITLSVVVTLNFRPLYYQEINRLQLPEISGMQESEIRENYDTLIDYNSIFYRGRLEFPSLAMSNAGRIHFEEVKNIFVFVQYLCMGSLIGALAMTIRKLRRKAGFAYLKLASVLTLAVPLILGGLIALNWDQFFVTFHHIFFQNDYWIFDPVTDPVITILPDRFFMKCAICILILVVIGSILCQIGYLASKRRAAKKTVRE